MRGHDDEAQDRKLFGKMLKKAMPHKKAQKSGKKLDTKPTKYAKVLP